MAFHVANTSLLMLLRSVVGQAKGLPMYGTNALTNEPMMPEYTGQPIEQVPGISLYPFDVCPSTVDAELSYVADYEDDEDLAAALLLPQFAEVTTVTELDPLVFPPYV